jgi:hypothetical protein
MLILGGEMQKIRCFLSLLMAKMIPQDMFTLFRKWSDRESREISSFRSGLLLEKALLFSAFIEKTSHLPLKTDF